MTTRPLSGLRQAFLNGSLTRLLDVDAVLKAKIVEFIGKGDFGLASGQQPAGFSRVWFNELMSADEIAFDGQTFLLLPSVAKTLTAAPAAGPVTPIPTPPVAIDTTTVAPPPIGVEPAAPAVLRLSGSIPPEIWNRVGNKLIPKLRTGEALDVAVGLTVEVSPAQRAHFIEEVRQILSDLGLADRVTIEAN